MHTRREFIASSGAVAKFGAGGGAAAVGLLSVTGRTGATEHYPDRPDHITATDNTSELEQYAPAFISTVEARTQMKGTYGWKAESDEHDTDAYYYWTRYATQESWVERWLPFASASDAHFLDHEPTVVYVDSDGAVDRVVCTGYHHLALEIPGDEATLRDGQHVVLEIVDPWHHYRHHEGDRDGVLAQDISQAEFDGWLDKREPWYDNGVYSKSDAGAVEDPWTMLERDSWWADGATDARAARLWAWLGLRGGDERDELRYES